LIFDAPAEQREFDDEAFMSCWATVAEVARRTPDKATQGISNATRGEASQPAAMLAAGDY
jgi:hypothetical protein